MGTKHQFNVGDWVEVRSKEEILATLDASGSLAGLPFMPEMLQFCGEKLQVFRRAHKTCDYTTPYPYRTRRIDETVHLQTRCDGQGHDGCEAGCLILWKEAWLKPAESGDAVATSSSFQHPKSTGAGCSEANLRANTKTTDPMDGVVRYICQATVTPRATTPLAWWDVRQYVEDYTSGNITLWRLFSGFVYATYFHTSQAGIGLGPAMRWLYNKFRWVWRGSLFPRTPGMLPTGSSTPAVTLNLQRGELVRIKPHLEILKTVDGENRNRGMFWDAELVPYCGGTYRVLRQVSKLIEERGGKMLNMKTPCIVLDSVTCQARYSQHRMFCPKAMYPYWREIWLERVADGSTTSDASESTKLESTCVR
jgi:hypothetical protein